MKELKKWRFRRLGGRRGFTLIELLIVMVILAILAGIVIISIGGVFGTAGETAYDEEARTIKTAVLEYYTDPDHLEWPTSGNTDPVTGTPGDPGVIDFYLLVTPLDGAFALLDSVPLSVNGVNCNVTMTNNGHYTWNVSSDGTVSSACAGTECTEVVDGYQDVYP